MFAAITARPETALRRARAGRAAAWLDAWAATWATGGAATWAGACCVTLAALALLCCGPARAAGVSLSLLVSTTPLSLPVYVAQARGFFELEGLDARITDCTGGFRCLQALLDRQGDIATVGDLPLALRAFQRKDFAVLATMAHSSEDLKLVADSGRGIATVAQLGGKRIGAVRGSASQYFLESLLFNAGIDPRGVTIVDLAPEGIAGAARSGAVDAVAIWEPYAHAAREAWGPRALVLPTATVYRQTFNLVAHRSLVGARDDALRRLLRAIERAQRYIHDEPAAARALLAARLKLDGRVAEAAAEGMGFKLGLDQSLVSTMESQARWARREGHVDMRQLPNYLELVHRAPLLAVNPSAVGLR
jgi:ABC-type nitrate/sulfonate/bicarbonate transport system substrate-binding protein